MDLEHLLVVDGAIVSAKRGERVRSREAILGLEMFLDSRIWMRVSIVLKPSRSTSHKKINVRQGVESNN